MGVFSGPLWVSRALSVTLTRLCHGQRVEKINNNHDQRTCCDCQLLGGLGPPPFGGDLECVDPLLDASVAHLSFKRPKLPLLLRFSCSEVFIRIDEPDVGAFYTAKTVHLRCCLYTHRRLQQTAVSCKRSICNKII